MAAGPEQRIAEFIRPFRVKPDSKIREALMTQAPPGAAPDPYEAERAATAD